MWLVAQDGLLERAVPLWSYDWSFDGWRFYCNGSCTFFVCVSTELLRDGRKGRQLGTPPCDNERTIALRTNALRAYEGKSSELIPPGPRSRFGTDCGSDVSNFARLLYDTNATTPAALLWIRLLLCVPKVYDELWVENLGHRAKTAVRHQLHHTWCTTEVRSSAVQNRKRDCLFWREFSALS